MIGKEDLKVASVFALLPQLDAILSELFWPEHVPQHLFEGLGAVVADLHAVAMRALGKLRGLLKPAG